MADIFLSYVRTDKSRVAPLVTALKAHGLDTWWDDDIPPDAPWEATIEQMLAGARVVVVCWSPEAVASENVRAEARWAKSKGKLTQLFLEPCEPPLFFGERQGVNLAGWRGEPDDPRVARLAARLAGSEAADSPRLTPARRQSSGRFLATAAAVLTVAATGGWLVWRGHSAPMRGTRIAVLPFETLGTDRGAAAFGAALNDQIVTALNSSEMPALSREDAATVRANGDAARLKELGVSLIFDGTVENDGQILAAKVHVNDPFQHVTLWTGGADGAVSDAASLRSQVTRTVVGVLACSNRALQSNGLTDPALLSRYLRACDLFVNQGNASNPKDSFEMLDDLRAVTAQAPGFAAAHSDLAKFNAYLAPLMPPDQAAQMRSEAVKEADAALRVEPRSPDAYLAKAFLLPPDHWAEREALLRHGVALDPKWPHTNGFLAQLLEETGRMREATTYAAHAAAADLQIDWRPSSARMLCNAGVIDPTIADLEAERAASPGDRETLFALTSCLIEAGRWNKVEQLEQAFAPPSEPQPGVVDLYIVGAKAAATRARPDLQAAHALALHFADDDPRHLRDAIQWLARLGFVDDAFAAARRYRPGYSMTAISSFLFTPSTASLRRDPRFLRLAMDYGLLGFWRSTGKWPDFCADPGWPYKCH